MKVLKERITFSSEVIQEDGKIDGKFITFYISFAYCNIFGLVYDFARRLEGFVCFNTRGTLKWGSRAASIKC